MPKFKMPDARSIDFETTGLDVYNGVKIFAYSIGYPDGDVDIRRVDGRDRNKNWQHLEDFFADTSTHKVAHNCKYEVSMTVVEKINVPKETIWEDTMIMSQMLQNLNPSHALDQVAWELCGYPRDMDVLVKRIFKQVRNYQRIPHQIMHDYQKADAQRCMLLFLLWYEEIKLNRKLFEDYRNEIDLCLATQRLEQFGITLDKYNTNKLHTWLTEELDKVDKESFEFLGKHVNLLSGKQLENLLYNEMKLPVIKKTKGGKPATDKDAISELSEIYDSPIFDLILRQRSYTKGLAMVNSYIKFAGEEGIIHPNIRTNRAVTGRQSSENPNMQNVSKNAVLKNKFPVPSRKCFRPKVGHVLFLVDYAGIEMRLIIDAANQESLIKLLQKNGDPHAVAAETFFGDRFTNEKDPKIKKTLRSAAKNGQFALAYGAGLAKIAQTLAIDQEEFRPGFEAYKRRFPKIANFTYSLVSQIKRDGYVTTPFGRKLFVPQDTAYAGSNYLIQGTAAGILKRAQVRVDKYLQEHWNDEIRIVIPIHDELIISYPRKLLKYRDEILTDIQELMTDIKEIKVPLEVEWKITTQTWDDAREIQIGGE